ncbi:pentapeptide repeat-containing protein [Nocardia transvalensis]|uniref:pentapeptide repeat-containing protein n=1 Tax=Nocardia transvalensis TaxID=37333 RepID=UPI001895E418|nr:pentapeptide repeat-containing protein [Nocardia transvalensis]MBF6331798.1 pentapeptide repeat-containing protein [Nocardia transvalensis]
MTWQGWTKIAGATTTMAAIAALWFTNQSLQATNRQNTLSQQVAVSDRLQKAAEQLASDKIDVRLAGIHVLARLAEDSPSDHATVFSMLTAFVRTHATASECSASDRDWRLVSPPPDIQTVLKVVGQRDKITSKWQEPIDLHSTCLVNASLSGNLRKIHLWGANLSGAYLVAVDLYDAQLRDAKLCDASLRDADLYRADLDHADLAGADLTGAYLVGANLAGANLNGTKLSGIVYDNTTNWPDGFMPPTE